RFRPEAGRSGPKRIEADRSGSKRSDRSGSDEDAVTRPGRQAADAHFRTFQRTGSGRALAQAFDDVAPELLRVARHLMYDLAAAEDIVQQTFVVAIENAARYDPDRGLRPWLLGILANEARSEWRRRSRRLDRSQLAHETVHDVEQVV